MNEFEIGDKIKNLVTGTILEIKNRGRRDNVPVYLVDEGRGPHIRNQDELEGKYVKVEVKK